MWVKVRFVWRWIVTVLRVLVEQAARMALALRPPDPGFLQHADRGSQYTGSTHQELLAKSGIVVSMSN
jgi:transposase InsO family protein